MNNRTTGQFTRKRAFAGQRYARLARFDGAHLGFSVDRYILFLKCGMQYLHRLTVRAGGDLICKFDDRHFGTQSAIDGRHLKPDDATADNHKVFGHFAQFKRCGAVPDAVILGPAGQLHRRRANGNNRLIKGPCRAVDLYGFTVFESRRAFDGLDFPAFRKPR